MANVFEGAKRNGAGVGVDTITSLSNEGMGLGVGMREVGMRDGARGGDEGVG